MIDPFLSLPLWQRDIVDSICRGEHVLVMGIRSGKTLMANEIRRRMALRPRLAGHTMDQIIIDEIPLDTPPAPVQPTQS